MRVRAIASLRDTLGQKSVPSNRQASDFTQIRAEENLLVNGGQRAITVAL